MASTQALLVVDDEVLILDVLQQGLAEAGYDIVQATSGSEAMEHLERDAARFGGVITDIRLGVGPDGWDVGRRARELAPHIQLIYVSGDSGGDWPSKGVPDSLMVSKPFAIGQIVTAISSLLVQDSTRGSVGAKAP